MSIVWRSAGTVRAIPVLPSMEAPPSSPSLQQEIPTCLRRRVETSATCSGSWSPIPHTLYFLRAEALGLVVGQCTRFPDPLHKGKTKRIVLYQDFLGSLCPEKQRTSSPSGTGPSGVDTHRPRDALLEAVVLEKKNPSYLQQPFRGGLEHRDPTHLGSAARYLHLPRAIDPSVPSRRRIVFGRVL